MKWFTLSAALLVCCISTNSADAGQAFYNLFNHGHNNCCESSCCAPAPSCCAPAPACCAPAPACCAPAPCCCAPAPTCCPAPCCPQPCCKKECCFSKLFH